MGYHDDIHEKIVSEGMDKTPEYVKKKIDDYQPISTTDCPKTQKQKKTRSLRMQLRRMPMQNWKRGKKFFRSSFVNYPADKLFLQIGETHVIQ